MHAPCAFSCTACDAFHPTSCQQFPRSVHFRIARKCTKKMQSEEMSKGNNPSCKDYQVSTYALLFHRTIFARFAIAYLFLLVVGPRFFEKGHARKDMRCSIPTSPCHGRRTIEIYKLRLNRALFHSPLHLAMRKWNQRSSKVEWLCI